MSYLEKETMTTGYFRPQLTAAAADTNALCCPNNHFHYNPVHIQTIVTSKGRRVELGGGGPTVLVMGSSSLPDPSGMLSAQRWNAGLVTNSILFY